MARLPKLYLGGKLLDLPHPFEEDVQFLVSATYDLLCENIKRREEEAIREAEKIEDPHEAGAERQWLSSNADELRGEARRIAVVTLVTRFQHWLRGFVKELTKKEPPNGVERNLKLLNESKCQNKHMVDRLNPRPSMTSPPDQKILRRPVFVFCVARKTILITSVSIAIRRTSVRMISGLRCQSASADSGPIAAARSRKPTRCESKVFQLIDVACTRLNFGIEISNSILGRISRCRLYISDGNAGLDHANRLSHGLLAGVR